MRKNMLRLMLFLLISEILIYAQATKSDRRIRIFQDNHEIFEIDGKYPIIEKPFQIVVNNIRNEDNIAIFAYHSDEMFNRYNYPIHSSDTVMFAPGTGIAMSIDDDTSFFLRINKEMSQNYITSDRRINIEHQAILRIKGFADTYNRYSENKIAYLTFFIDSNKNRIIEANEINNIVIKVHQSTVQAEKTKVYHSTIGSSIEINDQQHEIYSNFILFKITNIDEATKFSDYLRYNTNYYNGLRRDGLGNVDYSTKNKYFLMTPKGLSIKALQPYHYSGEDALIFDIVATEEEKSQNYCSLRTYTVLKDDDIFTFLVHWNDRYIHPVLITEF